MILVSSMRSNRSACDLFSRSRRAVRPERAISSVMEGSGTPERQDRYVFVALRVINLTRSSSALKRKAVFSAYTHPAGGWGSVHSLTRSLTRERVPLSGTRILMHQNKPQGFACVSCSWAKPANPPPFEFCEEGAKATTWEITNRRCTPEFFAEHTARELEIVDRSRS